MNPRDLYTTLVQLTNDREAFYFQDTVLDGIHYRIFNYRLASYTDFMAPGALECRGSMFETTPSGEFIRMASRPPQKFFNLGENPQTIGLDLTKVDTIELKADGSLMSTYMHRTPEGDVVVRLKSKGSLFSEQAVDANKWLNLPEHRSLRDVLWSLGTEDIAFNLEWCAPQNRIVIGYPTAHLRVLNARRNATGQYLGRDVLEHWVGDYLIDRVDVKGVDVKTFVEGIAAMTDDIEGYVCRIGDLFFKCKTEKYVSLHHAKDSINNPRRLFECVIDEAVDDLRSMFATDPTALTIIDRMTDEVTTMYNHVAHVVTQYHTDNKHLSRKDYAIGAQSLKLKNERLLGLVMSLYLGQEPDYKAWFKSRYKELGFRDSTTTPVSE